jgi:hypothetical protein
VAEAAHLAAAAVVKREEKGIPVSYFMFSKQKAGESGGSCGQGEESKI